MRAGRRAGVPWISIHTGNALRGCDVGRGCEVGRAVGAHRHHEFRRRNLAAHR